MVEQLQKNEKPRKREDAKEPGSLAFIMKKLFSKQLTVIGFVWCSALSYGLSIG